MTRTENYTSVDRMEVDVNIVCYCRVMQRENKSEKYIGNFIAVPIDIIGVKIFCYLNYCRSYARCATGRFLTSSKKIERFEPV